MKSTEKSISSRFAEIWAQLNHNQRRFVVAMLDAPNKKEAAEAIDITPDTVYRWPTIVDEAVTLLGGDIRNAVVEIISSGAAKAALVKLAGLDSDSEQTRQGVASEILDRILGKAISHMDIQSGGKPLFDIQEWKQRAEKQLETIGQMEEPECGAPDS